MFSIFSGAMYSPWWGGGGEGRGGEGRGGEEGGEGKGGRGGEEGREGEGRITATDVEEK